MTVDELKDFLKQYTGPTIVVVENGGHGFGFSDILPPRMTILKSYGPNTKVPALVLACSFDTANYEEVGGKVEDSV